MFVIIAIALIGLICIGLMGLGGILFFTQANRAQDEAAAIPSPPTLPPPTFTPTGTPTATPTNTSEPTPTSTPVVDNGDGIIPEPTEEQQPVETPTTDPNATPTNTRVLQTPIATATSEPTDTPTPPSASIPDSGGILPTANKDFLFWAGGGFLMILLGYAIFSRFRSSVQAPQE